MSTFTLPQPGPNTWPITLVSYVYIRKDLSFISNVAARTLLKAFATALFDEEYIGLCGRYGLIPVPSDLRELSLAGIDLVDAADDGDANKWTFEVDTIPGAGQGDLVISQKRESFTLYEADRLADDVAAMQEEVRLLKLEMASMRASVAESAAGMFEPSVVLGLGAAVATMFFAF